MPAPHNAPGYEEDFVAWLEDQARRARRRETDALDLDNIAEELEGLARSDRREIRSRLTVLLLHLLKYQFQPRRRTSGWRGTIIEQRRRIAGLIEESPSLHDYPASVLDRCYAEAREDAARETRLPESDFSERCPFPWERVLDPAWLP